jgi:hypothetical protein
MLQSLQDLQISYQDTSARYKDIQMQQDVQEMERYKQLTP